MVERLPRWVFANKTQLAIDAGAAATAIVAALFVRFELQTVRLLPTYILWLPLIAVLRPLLLLLLGSYRSTWRHFHLVDGLNLATNSAVLSIALIAFRLFGSFGLRLRALPYSVAIIELGLFITFAASFYAFCVA